jgi:AraC-like DNA-binding protein
MRVRPAAPLTLGEMAGLGFMSPFHFNRVFRLMTGIPPGLFQSALRFESAKMLLLTTSLHVTEICDRLGFLSPATFARQFKARVGVAPDRLRRLAKLTRESPQGALDPLVSMREIPQFQEGLAGEVVAPEGFDGLVVVALFKRATPEGWPTACAVRPGSGTFLLPPLPDGTYHLLAAGVDRRMDVSACLVNADTVLRSDVRGLRVLVHGGKIFGLPEGGVRLRHPDPLDPPILFAFPALLLEPLLNHPGTAVLCKRAG